MAFVEDLSPFFADFGEAVVVAGVPAVGIFNAASDVVLGDVVTTAPSLELPASVVAAEGDAVAVRSASYLVRQVLNQPPDGALRLLVLARV